MALDFVKGLQVGITDCAHFLEPEQGRMQQAFRPRKHLGFVSFADNKAILVETVAKERFGFFDNALLELLGVAPTKPDTLLS
jgi:hypothetical protein